MQFTKKHSVLTVKQILGYHERGKLNLNPGFQRESVWQEKERRELIDTILRGMPLPNVFLWEHKEGNKVVLDVIDGKQRIESILEFTKKIKPLHLKAFSPDRLSGWDYQESWDWSWKELQLEEPKVAREFLKYEIPTVVVKGSLYDIERVFVRINSTGKKLTKQEIRHARWQKNDVLKQAEAIAKSNNKYFRELHILSEGQITRMKAVELVSEIMLSIANDSVLDKKAALDRIIGNDAIHGSTLARVSRETKSILKYLEKNFSSIKTTRFRKVSDFYALVFSLWKMKRDACRLNDNKAIELATVMLTSMSLELSDYSQSVKDGKPKRLSSVARRYHDTVVAGTDTARNRNERVRIIESLMRTVFKSKDKKRLFTPEQKELLWHGNKDKKCAHPGCNVTLTWDNVQIDHIKAHSKGGRTNLANAQLMCAKHNQKKGNK